MNLNYAFFPKIEFMVQFDLLNDCTQDTKSF